MKILQEDTMNTTVGQIVANCFRTADVFKKYNIDFCCKGGKLLKNVCEEKGLDFELIKTELLEKEAGVANIPETDYLDMQLDDLVAHIEKRHHAYVRENASLLMGYLYKVNSRHGKNHPELGKILNQFIYCSDELLEHMDQEEAILFPAIKKLAECDRADETISKAFSFGKLSSLINTMQQEHVEEGDRCAAITELTNNFKLPSDACATYKVAYQKLEEFINDLYTHIHLENNILFPKAIVLEEKLVHPMCQL